MSNVHDLDAVADAVLKNVDWLRDVTVVDGPVDQLDHCAIRDSYGGKIGIDATRKPDRGPLRDCVTVAPERLNRLVGDNWSIPCDGVLIVAADKSQRRVREWFGALWRVCPDANLIVLDQGVDVRNLSEVAWRTLGNVDWRRDILINSGPVDHFAQGQHAARPDRDRRDGEGPGGRASARLAAGDRDERGDQSAGRSEVGKLWDITSPPGPLSMRGEGEPVPRLFPLPGLAGERARACSPGEGRL